MFLGMCGLGGGWVVLVCVCVVCLVCKVSVDGEAGCVLSFDEPFKDYFISLKADICKMCCLYPLNLM